jgi:hypothetical protein
VQGSAAVEVVLRSREQLVANCRPWRCAVGGRTQKAIEKSWTRVFSFAEFRAGIETPWRPAKER